MSSSSKRFLLRQAIVADTGCSCRSSKLSSFFSFSSSQKQSTPKTPFLSSSSATPTTSQSDFSPDAPAADKDSSFDDSQSSSPSPVNIPASELRENWGLKRKGAMEQSVAVVKESWNPYFDFRESMIVMIVEKELYSWDSLCDLLHQFLSLNSPDHHHHILRAFAEVWNDIFSPFAAGGGGGGGESCSRDPV